jgi:DNA gyrase subunit A
VRGTDTEGEEEGDVIGMVIIRRESSLLVVTEKGYGKRTEVGEYRVTGRGGKGILTLKTTDRNGPLVSIHEVVDSDELMIISKKGVLIRLPIANVSTIGGNGGAGSAGDDGGGDSSPGGAGAN